MKFQFHQYPEYSQTGLIIVTFAWVPYLAGLIELQFIILCLHAAFKELYPHTTAIVDATEIRVNIPSSLSLQSQTYSNYKSTNTFKALIAISPAGHVTFVLSLYTGCISDTQLVERSGFLSLLQKGDEIWLIVDLQLKIY